MIGGLGFGDFIWDFLFIRSERDFEIPFSFSVN